MSTESLITGIPQHLEEPNTPHPERFVDSPMTQLIGEIGLDHLRPRYGEHARELGIDEITQKNTEFGEKLKKSDDPADKNTGELRTFFPPTSGIEINGTTFFLSDKFSVKNREHCIGYTELEDATIAPRLFYKSNSDGEWRVSPVFYREIDVNGRERAGYSKGEQLNYGYVRETRLHDDLRLALTSTHQGNTIGPDQLRWVTDHFSEQSLGKTNTYKSEVMGTKLSRKDTPDLFAFEPGAGFDSDDDRQARDVLAGIHLPEISKPNFTKSTNDVRFSQHPVLGLIRTESYPTDSGHLVWNMSIDKDGRVWVSGVTSGAAPKLTSYGTDDDVVVVGVYDNKPVEYSSQVSGLEEGRDFKDLPAKGYVDITPLLDNLEIVKEFRSAKQVVRTSHI